MVGKQVVCILLEWCLVSLHIRSMWETAVMHKQVSGWTVNFGPNFPESPFLELKTRKAPPYFGKLQIWDDQSLLWNTPPPPFWKTSDLGWPKFTPEYPPSPHFGKLQIWHDRSLLWNTAPHFGKLQIWDDQSLLRNTPPPHFGKLQIWHDHSLLRNNPPIFRKLQIGDDQSLLRNPPPPHFGKLQIWHDQSLLWNPPSPLWKLSESPSLRVSECRELLHVETLSNPDNYSFYCFGSMVAVATA